MTNCPPWFVCLVGALSPQALHAVSDVEGEKCEDVRTLPAAVALFPQRSPAVDAAEEAHRERTTIDAEIPSVVGNPVLRATAGPRLLPASDVGVEGGLGVYLPVHAGGQGFAQRRVASWSRAALLAERDRAALEATLAGVRAWLSLYATETDLEIALEEAALAAEWAELLQRATDVGIATTADAARLAAYRAQTDLEVRALEGDRFDLAVELGALLGCEVGAARLAPPEPLPALPASEALLKRAAAHPRVTNLDHELASLGEEQDALLRSTWGSLEVGVVAEKDGPGNYRALVELQAPLPVVERAPFARGELALRGARTRAAREQALRATRAELRRALHEVAHTAEVLEVAAERLEPATGEAERLEALSIQAGTLPVTDWMRARSERIRARRTRNAAFVAHARARWELALLSAALQPPRVAE